MARFFINRPIFAWVIAIVIMAVIGFSIFLFFTLRTYKSFREIWKVDISAGDMADFDLFYCTQRFYLCWYFYLF